MQAIILAGGLGMRLRPLTLTTPKPMIPIHGKPFVEHLVMLLKKNGVDDIVFLTGYLGEQFPAHFGDGSKWGLRIRYSHSVVDDDTGERIRKASSMLGEQSMLLYGDNYWPLELAALKAHHEKMNTLATVTVFERPDAGGKNNIRVEDGLVTVYDKSRTMNDLNGVDIGFYILAKAVTDRIPEGNVNFEAAVLPGLVAEGELAGFLTQKPYTSLTSIEKLSQVEAMLHS